MSPEATRAPRKGRLGPDPMLSLPSSLPPKEAPETRIPEGEPPGKVPALRDGNFLLAER